MIMESVGKRKRSRPRPSLITDFLNLRDSSPSLVQTGPKRRKGGVALTPARLSKSSHDPLKLASLGHSNPSPSSLPLTSASLLKSTFKEDAHSTTPSTSKSRVSFDHLVSVQEFTPDISAPSPRVHDTPPASPPRHDTVRLLPPSSPKGREQEKISKTPSNEGSPSNQESPSNRGKGKEVVELEPLSSGEESDDSDDDEPHLTTPQLEGVTGYHGNETLKSTDFRSMDKGKKSRHGKSGQTTRTKSSVKSTLSRALIKNIFCLYSKRRVTREAMDLILKFSDDYLKQVSLDAAVYSRHAGRKTITTEDIVLLLKRQRVVNSRESFEYLVNTYLPMEYATVLLPCSKQ